MGDGPDSEPDAVGARHSRRKRGTAWSAASAVATQIPMGSGRVPIEFRPPRTRRGKESEFRWADPALPGIRSDESAPSFEGAVRTVAEQAKNASAIVDEAHNAGLDGSYPVTLQARCSASSY
jgi:hypothetical protein